MTKRTRRHLLRSVALVGSVLLAGCGDGGVNSTPAPTPAPAPAPSPSPSATPTPTPTQSTTCTANSATEYCRSVGAVSANAIVAYNKGATGLGVPVAVIDSGIDLQSPEFGTRISAASANVAGGTTIDDQGGHGTAVAFTIAGRSNGTGAEGMAYNATLIIARADTPGSCAASTPDKSACSFDDDAIARGIDLARQNGARAINISLGGPDPSAQSLLDAVNRATSAGVIIVVSAGNDGVTNPALAVNPEVSAQYANDPSVAHGLVIVAGSVGANPSHTPGADVISSFSNRAGNTAAHYLAAVGENVLAPDQNNSAYIWSGTSFAAPQIVGAVALLAQAFPNLTGAQIVQLLFQSARDAGAAGVDPVYGGGVLDLTAAFQPQGAMSVAGTTSIASLTANATLSAPMGDAAQGPLGTVVLDSFARAFAVDLAGTIHRDGPSPMLVPALQSTTHDYALARGGTSLSLTVAPARAQAASSPVLLSEQQAQQARAIAGIVTSRLGHDASVAIGFAQGGRVLEARLAGRAEPAFLIAQDPTRAMGFATRAGGATAVRRQFGRWGVTATVETGDTLARDRGAMPALADRYRRYGYDQATLTFDRRAGPLALALGTTRLAERDSLLGAHFGDGLGGTRGTSWFVDAAARLDLAGWTLGGSLRRGWTRADVRGGLTGGGTIRTRAFAADLGRANVFGRHDSIGLRVSQPLRVTRGGIDLTLPVDYDYATDAVSAWRNETLNLTPTGRERDVELRYAMPLWLGTLQTNAFWRQQPGNFASLPDDKGVAARWSMAF